MERGELVRRERSAEDRRMVLITLTKEGRDLASRIEVEPMEIFRDALRALPAAEVEQLFRILGCVQQNVRESQANRDTKNAKT